VISKARPKIANYPFTTKEPNLGVAEVHDGVKLVIADIPGLIEGAHHGRGLGHKFLRHLERTKALIHLVDIAAVDGRDPYCDYVKLNKELKLYSGQLAKKPQVLVLNKMDCDGAAAAAKAFKRKVRNKKVVEISAVTGEGIKTLLKEVHKLCKK
jgi:GTP-binding protein